jgi:hypothetical protein
VSVLFDALFLCLNAIDNGTCGVVYSDAFVYCIVALSVRTRECGYGHLFSRRLIYIIYVGE